MCSGNRPDTEQPPGSVLGLIAPAPAAAFRQCKPGSLRFGAALGARVIPSRWERVSQRVLWSLRAQYRATAYPHFRSLPPSAHPVSIEGAARRSGLRARRAPATQEREDQVIVRIGGSHGR